MEVKLQHIFTLSNKYRKSDEPINKEFEKIRQKVIANWVIPENAKEFISTLSEKELKVLQEYNNLQEPIDIDMLHGESAFNLLNYSYEKFDFDHDGFIEVASSNNKGFQPLGMDPTMTKAYHDATQGFSDIEKRDVQRLFFQASNVVPWFNTKENSSNVIDFKSFQERVLKQIENSNHPLEIATLKKFWDKFQEVYPHKNLQNTDNNLREEFVDKVRAAGGMLAYIQQLNYEKIEELVKEKRAQLEKKYGLYALPLKTVNESSAISKNIDKELELYRESLIKELNILSKKEPLV